MYSQAMPSLASSEPFSYRDDPNVPTFDDGAPLIIFDGLCVLCAGGVQWMLARDSNGSSRFAAIQEPIPQALYKHYDLDAAAFDTFLVLCDGVAHTKWAGVLAAGRTLLQPWRLLSFIGRAVPRVIGDWAYDIIQRNRLRWFGSRQTCFAPDPAQRARFLSGLPSGTNGFSRESRG